MAIEQWPRPVASCTKSWLVLSESTRRRLVAALAITPVINGISRVNPLITGVITQLLSGMSHQVAWLLPGFDREHVVGLPWKPRKKPSKISF